MEVSSVQAPAGRRNGPLPTMSSIGGKVPGAQNSSVVPSASPIEPEQRAADAVAEARGIARGESRHGTGSARRPAHSIAPPVYTATSSTSTRTASSGSERTMNAATSTAGMPPRVRPSATPGA